MNGYTEIYVKDGNFEAIDLMSNTTNEIVATVRLSGKSDAPLGVKRDSWIHLYSARQVANEIEVLNWLLKKHRQHQNTTLWQKLIFNYCRVFGHNLNQDDKCLRCKVKFGGLYE